MAPVARYVSLIIEADPGISAGDLLSRPDVGAVLADALAEAHAAVSALVEQSWLSRAEPDATYRSLLADAARQYAALSHLRALVRQAHASARPAERPAAARQAVLGWARQAAIRSGLTVAVAEQAAETAATLAEAHARRAAGEHVFKRWTARRDGTACHWCRKLDGVTIGLEDSFLPYLGGAADLSGHGRLTQPPKPYRGELQGPPLHPHCRCKLMVVTEIGTPGELRARPAAAVPVFTAAQIRAMPAHKYQAMMSFLGAALHELGQMLHRLGGAAGR